MMYSYGKRLISLLLCTALLFSPIISVPAGTLPYNQTESSKGFLSVDGSSPGLVIMVDDAFVGLTPLENYSLATGEHTIRVRHPTRANWLDPDWVQQIDVTADDTVRLHVVLKVSYNITSVPYGAEVSSNGQVLGQTPLSIRLDMDEQKEVLVRLRGYRDVMLELGSSSQRFFRLQLEPALSNEIDPQAYQVPVRGRNNTLLYSAAAVALTSGAVALYFRNRGDQAYDAYLSTGEPEAINRHYDRAKKYDRYAAAAFGVFQISFVTSFYLYLKRKLSR